MSRSHQIARQRAKCLSKKPYSKEGIARVRGQQRIERGGDCPPMLWPYRCPVCPSWHLTHHAQANQPPITARLAYDFAAMEPA